MATLPLTPVQLVDEVIDIDCQADGAIITLGSYGAPIRVRMSRHQVIAFGHKCVRKATSMQLVEQQNAEIIEFRRTA